MNVRILRPALEDIARSRTSYDGKEIGVGDYFMNSLFSEIDSLSMYGGIHSIHFGFHRMLAKKFPFAIYYKITQEEVVVFRVLDCRRDPRNIRKSLGASA